MRLNEHALLNRLQTTTVKRRKTEMVTEVASICLTCEGRCKASVSLVRCPTKERMVRK